MFLLFIVGRLGMLNERDMGGYCWHYLGVHGSTSHHMLVEEDL